jgi:Mlc titration factor MtfA (ptsG expression regulator)
MRDRSVDGTPVLRSPEQYRRWVDVMTREFTALQEAADHGRRTLLNPYGCEDEAEFFAVATESFFEQPLALRRHHPELYEVLAGYYLQDPAARAERQKAILAESSPPRKKRSKTKRT